MKIGGQRALRQLGDGAGHLDAGRSAADHREGHQPAALLGIAFVLGTLERHQDAAAQIGGVVDGFQARRIERPVVAAEIGVARAGREHEIVVRHAAAVGDRPRGS